MFDFKKYSKLKEYHKKWNNLVDDTYKSESKFNRTNEKKDHDLWVLANKKVEEFDEIYAQEIFKILKDKKPILHNYIDEKYEKWDDVVKKYKLLTLGSWVISLVEEDGGRYRLPPEYYR
ncbi:MAG: hypothetical protein NC133_04285 [Prevotella sp.]|nr:hypothetical protein [Prevotella sp.]